jgi:ArsR family transcriptional regulator
MKKELPIACCPPLDDTTDLRPVEGPEAETELAALARSISHPVRVRILRMLSDAAMTGCGDIVDALPLAQSTVSQHLKILREAGLIRGDVEGTRRSYCIDPRGLRRLRALTAAL